MHYLPEKENKTLNTNYHILRTIGRDFFPQHTGMKLKKNLVYKLLYFAVGFFLNKKTKIIDVFGVIFLFKAIKVYLFYTNRGCNSGGKCSTSEKKNQYSIID